MNVHHISSDTLIKALDRASSYLASDAEPFHAFPLKYWIHEWLPAFVAESMEAGQ